MRILYLFIISQLLFSCHQRSNENNNLILTSGTVDRIENFESEFIVARNVDVWLPNNYSDKKKYAVLYMHDGQMLFDATKSWNKQEWKVDEVLSKLILAEEIPETIVVGIWNTEFRHSEFFPQKAFESLPVSFQDTLLNFGVRSRGEALFKTKVISDNYLKFIVEELKPYIDRNYSTKTTFENTAVAGSSMGGLISLYAICEYPEVFSAAGCLSTHWIGTFDTLNNPIPKAFADYLDQNLPNQQTHKIYFDYGTETLDALYEPSQQMIDEIMVKHKFDEHSWVTKKFDRADHSEKSWSKRLDIPIKFLLSHTAK